MSYENILSHYNKHELTFAEKVLKACERVMNTHEPFLTDFFDPRQLEITRNIVNSMLDLTMFFDGGYIGAERVRILIAPEYWSYHIEELGVTIFKIMGENKFNQLTHKDYLGALMNIGVKREKFGDILISDNQNYYIIANEISDYVQLELRQIGHTKVYLEEIERSEMKLQEQEYQYTNITVSSLRIDTILSHVYNLSRAKVSEAIKGNKLKVNWQIMNQGDFNLKVGDIVSLRGFGRFKLFEENGTSKKGKIRIKVGRYL